MKDGVGVGVGEGEAFALVLFGFLRVECDIIAREQ